MSGRAQLIACETCGGNDRDAEGRPRGARLLAQLHEVASDEERAKISGVRCLWACKRSCAVHVRSANRVGYVLAELEPNAETARALLDYVALYEESADGAVPFRQWPVVLKGHFLCRLPAPAPLDPLAHED